MMRFLVLLITRYSPLKVGGADRDRTDDLRLAKPALSQLSYSPGQLTSTNIFLPSLCDKINDRPLPSIPKPAGHCRGEDGTEELADSLLQNYSYFSTPRLATILWWA